MSRYLLCTDLDRTLIPNGPSPLCPPAASLFRQLAAREELSLAYVTGRHRALIEDAIAEFELPCPDFAIADVGASIHEVSAQGWRPWRMWEEHIATDWRGMNSEGLRKLLRGLPELQLQEKEKQAPFKLSFYVRLNADSDTLTAMIRQRLLYEGIRANLISSVDELAGIGLLDVLPQSAGKLHAIRFLM
ncbi:MAG: HAD family hydrolase, partial [Desulfomicrobium sp.]|nr:HAD family hydrolase [Desulfomicrobium sp.]